MSETNISGDIPLRWSGIFVPKEKIYYDTPRGTTSVERDKNNLVRIWTSHLFFVELTRHVAFLPSKIDIIQPTC